MKQQMLEQELAALRDQLKEVGQERDDWKLLAGLYAPEKSMMQAEWLQNEILRGGQLPEPAVDAWMPDLLPDSDDTPAYMEHDDWTTDLSPVPTSYPEPTRKNDYNGWKNRETWQVNLWFDNDLDGLDADSIEEMVREHLNADEASGTLLGDIIYDFLSSVDFEELAEAHKSDEEDIEDEE